MLPPGLQRNPPGSTLPGAHFARGKNRGLRKFAVSGKLGIAKLFELSGNRTMQTRLPRRVLLFRVLGVSASRKSGPHVPDCTHMASLPDYRQPINQPRYPLVRKARLYLDDISGFLVFLGIRTIGICALIPALVRLAPTRHRPHMLGAK